MIVYTVAMFGLAYIVGHSAISLPFRTWLGGTPPKESLNVGLNGTANPMITPGKAGALGPLGDFLCALIECPACFGFWCGLLLGFVGLIFPPAELELVHHTWPVMLGCYTAGSNFALSRLTRLI